MHNLSRDLRLSVRRLIKSPGFTALCVLTLALGIGANTAIFSVLYGVLLRPLPYADPDRVMVLWETEPQRPRSGVSAPDFFDWRTDSRSFAGLSGFGSWAMTWTGDSEPELLRGRSVSGNFFSVLGVEAELGRVFDPQADGSAEQDLVVLDHGFWQRRFGADRAVIGRTMVLDGKPYTVVGVLPASFEFPGSFQPVFWVRGQHEVPKVAQGRDVTEQRGFHYFLAVGRLAPGVTRAAAQSEMDVLMQRYADTYPETNAERGALVTPLDEWFVGEIRPALLMLMGAVGFVLLIACGNIANLLLARATAQQPELAIRNAVGADRSALFRQLLTDCVALALAGGLLGLPLAFWGLKLLLRLAPATLPRLGEITVSTPVLLFTLAVAVVTALVFGTLPALQSCRPDLRDLLTRGHQSGGGHRPSRSRSLLIIAEVALALVLLIGAGLLIRSLLLVRAVDLGFNPEGVLSMGIVLPHTEYDEDARIAAFHRQVLENIAALPEVESVGLVGHLPLTGTGQFVAFEIQGQPAPRPGKERKANYQPASADYFRTLGLTLLDGRGLLATDTADSQPVVVISETLKRRYWPDQSALGQRISFDPERRTGGGGRKVNEEGEKWWTVVGVVGDVRHRDLEQEVKPEVYLSYEQSPTIYVNLVVRTRGEPIQVANAVRRRVAAVDRKQPVFRVRPMIQLVAHSIAERQFLMVLLGLFAALALIMACLGIYGVMAYSVSRRTLEIGIRLAVGARRSQVLGLMIRQGFLLVGSGLVLGLPLAFFVARAMSGLLYGIEALDPLTFVLVPLLLIAVALLANFLSTRRAARIDPAVSLRSL